MIGYCRPDLWFPLRAGDSPISKFPISNESLIRFSVLLKLLPVKPV